MNITLLAPMYKAHIRYSCNMKPQSLSLLLRHYCDSFSGDFHLHQSLAEWNASSSDMSRLLQFSFTQSSRLFLGRPLHLWSHSTITITPLAMHSTHSLWMRWPLRLCVTLRCQSLDGVPTATMGAADCELALEAADGWPLRETAVDETAQLMPELDTLTTIAERCIIHITSTITTSTTVM